MRTTTGKRGTKRCKGAMEYVNELEALKIQTDRYLEDLEEMKELLGPDYIPLEQFKDVQGKSAGGVVRAGDFEDANAYLRHANIFKKVVASTSPKATSAHSLSRESNREEHLPSLFAGEMRDNVARALRLNRRLQKRMDLLVASNALSIQEHDKLEERIQEMELEKRRRNKDLEQGAWRYMLGRSMMEYDNGKSWFFRGASYVNTTDFVRVANHVTLASKSGEWSKEEREGLIIGVEEMAKERRVLKLIETVDCLEDFEMQQEGLRSLALTLEGREAGDGECEVEREYASNNQSKAPTTALKKMRDPWGEVIQEADAMTVEEWETLAWRHVPKRTGRDCMLQWRNSIKPTVSLCDFSDDELKQLKQLVKRYGEHAESWEVIAGHLPGRTPLACLRQYMKESTIKAARTREEERRRGNLCFTREDVQRVCQLVLKHGQSWKKVAKEFGGSWTPQQIMFEWRKHIQATAGGTAAPKKGKWSKEEDDALIKAVAVLGRQWARVAQHVPGRTEMQVRERYVNHLDPEVESNRGFSGDELEVVRREVPNHTDPKSGRISWSKVARLLPSRTDRQVKKAWERINRNNTSTKNAKGKRRKAKRNPWDED
jgi:hypothetical protein